MSMAMEGCDLLKKKKISCCHCFGGVGGGRDERARRATAGRANVRFRCQERK